MFSWVRDVVLSLALCYNVSCWSPTEPFVAKIALQTRRVITMKDPFKLHYLHIKFLCLMKLPSTPGRRLQVFPSSSVRFRHRKRIEVQMPNRSRLNFDILDIFPLTSELKYGYCRMRHTHCSRRSAYISHGQEEIGKHDVQ